MTKKKIIYDNLLSLLRSLTSEGMHFQSFYESLEEEQQNNLLSTSEDIEVEINLISEAKDGNQSSFSLEKLVQLLEKFKNEFSAFPENRINEIFLLIELLSRLQEASYNPISLEEEVDTELFGFIELTKNLSIDNFIYYDTTNLDNSIVLLNLNNTDSIQEYFDSNSLPTELIFHLLCKVGSNDHALKLQKYVLIKKSIETQIASVWACLAMHIVRVGKLVHSSYHYNALPQVSSSRMIESGKDYQQFKDTIVILSEYNEQKDLLDKYIRLYHVVENFMYKYPLVKLERSHAGAVFSIRDFQRMYDKIRTSEITALTNLMKRVCDEEYSTGVTFGNFILTKWHNLIPTAIPNDVNVNSLLSRLRITKKQNNDDIDVAFNDLTIDNVVKYFSTIVYAFRNSLVHNRETEFHLTQETILNHPDISDCGRSIIEHFLIPVIEEIVFFLIINENEIVWFQNSSLVLFEKH